MKNPFEKTFFVLRWGVNKHRCLKCYSVPTVQRVLTKPLLGTSKEELCCVHSQPTIKESLLERLPSTPCRETTELNFDPLEVHDQSPPCPLRRRTISFVLSSEKMEIYVLIHKNTQS